MSKRRTRRARVDAPSTANSEAVLAALPMDAPQSLSGSRAVPDVTKNPPTRVSVVNRWKDYLAQSLLIVFSVLLALGLSELMTSIREARQTQELIANVRAEVLRNQTAAQEQHQYNLRVLQNIDAALASTELQRQFVSNDELHLERIAPDGVLYRYLHNAAWEVARSRNIAAKLNIATMSLLSRIYEDQARIMKMEDEVARLLLGAEGRNAENVRRTLLLIRDNYKGWAVDRTPALLKRYDEALALLRKP
jgi:hypothetical protein